MPGKLVLGSGNNLFPNVKKKLLVLKEWVSGEFLNLSEESFPWRIND